LTLAKGREGVNAAGLTRGRKAVILRNLHVVFGEPSDAGGHRLFIHRFGLCLHLARAKKSRDHAAIFDLAADCSALVPLPYLDFDRYRLRYVVQNPGGGGVSRLCNFHCYFAASAKCRRTTTLLTWAQSNRFDTNFDNPFAF
jgi:hypothetical protein